MGLESISFSGVILYLLTIIVCAVIRDGYSRIAAAIDLANDDDNSSTIHINTTEAHDDNFSPLAPPASPVPPIARARLRPFWSDPTYTETAAIKEAPSRRHNFSQAELDHSRELLFADFDRRHAPQAKKSHPLVEEDAGIASAATTTTETAAAARTSRAPVYTAAMFSLKLRAIERSGPLSRDDIEQRKLRALPDHLQRGLIGRREDGLWLSQPIGYEPMLVDITAATLLPLNAVCSSTAEPIQGFNCLGSAPEAPRAVESFAPSAPVLFAPIPQYQAAQAPVVATEAPRPTELLAPRNSFFPAPAVTSAPARPSNMFGLPPCLLPAPSVQVSAPQPPVMPSEPPRAVEHNPILAQRSPQAMKDKATEVLSFVEQFKKLKRNDPEGSLKDTVKDINKECKYLRTKMTWVRDYIKVKNTFISRTHLKDKAGIHRTTWKDVVLEMSALCYSGQFDDKWKNGHMGEALAIMLEIEQLFPEKEESEAATKRLFGDARMF
jgi:hypothetical protein